MNWESDITGMILACALGLMTACLVVAAWILWTGRKWK